MKTILGTGQLGMAIMELLLQMNPLEKILLVNRMGKLYIPAKPNVQVIAADVTSKTDMERIAKRSSIIFSCTDVPYPAWDSFYPAAAKALAHALENSTAKLVFADNLYSYGNVKGAEMNEGLPNTAHTKKGAIRAQVIKTLLYPSDDFTGRVAFVKAADFIGPRIYKGVFGTDFFKQALQ